jgi:ABC-type glycerol-3-phosphate transport system substrate-binding protein
MSTKRLMLVLAGLAGLAACGGGGGVSDSTSGGGIDSFTSAVGTVIASTSDSSEPVSIDGAVVVEVDNTDAPPT